MKIFFISLLLVLYTTISFAALGDALSIPPQAHYNIIETKHFTIIYPQEYEPEAKKAAQYFENAHETLAPVFQYHSSRKMTAILTDNEDFANGVTSAIGRQGIALYLTPPEPYTSIGEYGDWLETLIVHEYSHYLTLNRTSGLFDFTRILFGDLLLPNHYWPSWLAEGMAVYAESVYSKDGRGHGTFYETLTRDSLFGLYTKSASDFFVQYDELSGPQLIYPFGEKEYYVGYGMIEQLTKEHGKDAPAHFTEVSAGNVPYFLNNTLQQMKDENSTTGAEEFQTLWKNWIHSEAYRLEPELTWLKQHDIKPTLYTKPFEKAIGSRVSPDGKWMAYYNSSGNERPALKIVNLKTHETQTLLETVGNAGLSWSEDSQTIYFSRADIEHSYYDTSDLYAYDLTKHKSYRLTYDERAKDPERCGNSLVYTRRKPHTTELVLRALANSNQLGNETILYTTKPYHHISNPRCSANAKTVYFSHHTTDSFDEIDSLEVSHPQDSFKKITGGTEHQFSALFPEPHGDSKLYFTQVDHGYYSLAEYDLNKKTIRTALKLSGGIWLPQVYNNEIYFTYVTSVAMYGASTPVATLFQQPTSTLKSSTPTVAKTTLQKPQTQISEPESYALYDGILPRIWAPYILLSTHQNQYGAFITGWDAVDSSEYSLTLYYDTIPKNLQGTLSTAFRMSGFRLSPYVKSQISSFASYSNGTVAFAEERTAGASLSHPFPGIYSTWTPSLFAQYSRTHFDGRFGRTVLHPEYIYGASISTDSRKQTTGSLTTDSGNFTQLKGLRTQTKSSFASKVGLQNELWVPLFKQHSTLKLNVSGIYSPHVSADLVNSVIKIGGSTSSDFLNPALRGYPQGNFLADRAALATVQLHLPLTQVFQGDGNFPLFIKNYGVYAFYDWAAFRENAVFTDSVYETFQRDERWRTSIASLGGGFLLNTYVGYHLPFQLRLEYASGLKKQLRGEDSLVLLFSL